MYFFKNKDLHTTCLQAPISRWVVKTACSRSICEYTNGWMERWRTGFLLCICLWVGNAIMAAPVQKSGSIETYMAGIISNMPLEAGNDYAVPKNWQMATWAFVLHEMLEANYTNASDSAVNVGYQLVEYTDNSGLSDKTYYLLENTGANYWGTYAYYPSHQRQLVIQAPHPRKDFNTGKQGIHVFYESEALFFAMSGTHRCNHAWFSSCAGSTDACGSWQDFRVSDMAHHDTSFFQATTDTLFSKYNHTYFIQLHGFTKKNSDPFVILSNGTDQTPTTDYIPTLELELYDEDNSLTFMVAHEDDWDRLVGFTNTQGRLINQSLDPCGQSASSVSGRFIHIEQEKASLRANSTGWAKMAAAVINTFPVNPLPVDLVGFDLEVLDNAGVRLYWETATELNNDFFEIQCSGNGSDWRALGRVQGAGNSLVNKHYEFITKDIPRSRAFYRLRQVDFDGTASYSDIRTLQAQAALRWEVFPNPAEFEVRVHCHEAKGFSLVLLDLTGRIHEVPITYQGNEAILYLGALPRGMYTLGLLHPDGWAAERLVLK